MTARCPSLVLHAAWACLLAAAVTGRVAAAGPPVDPQTPLRDVLAGKAVTVPGGSFDEPPAVLKLCLSDSLRQPVRDSAGSSHVNDAAFRQVMQQGRQLAQTSDAWGRALGTHLLLQRQLPGRSAETLGVRLTQQMVDNIDWGRGPRPVPTPTTVSPQQADMDFNFAILEARRGELEASGQAYIANIRTIELNALRSIGKAGLPPADMLDVLKQLERWREDDSVCIDERLIGRKGMDALSQFGWPVSSQERLPPTVAWHSHNARSHQADEQFSAEFAQLAAVGIADARARVAGLLREAKAANDLPRIMFTTFGSGQLNTLALADPAIGRDFEARSTALRFEEQKRLETLQRKLAAEQEQRAAANRARIASNVRSNGAPQLTDIQDIVLQQSLRLSVQESRGAKGVQTSPSDYEMSALALGQPFKTAAVTLRVSDLRCRPERNMQRCDYTEQFDWTRYALFENLVIPRATSVEKRSALFKWTNDGLEVEGQIETYAVGWIQGGSSGSPDGRGGREQTFAEIAAQRDRDNQQRYFDRTQGSMRPPAYNPQKQY